MEDNNQWRMQSIRLDYKDYGEHKGKYTGEIKFENKQQESFAFKISPEKSDQFLALIKDVVIESANELGNKLIQSLPSPNKIKAL